MFPRSYSSHFLNVVGLLSRGKRVREVFASAINCSRLEAARIFSKLISQYKSHELTQPQGVRKCNSSFFVLGKGDNWKCGYSSPIGKQIKIKLEIAFTGRNSKIDNFGNTYLWDTIQYRKWMNKRYTLLFSSISKTSYWVKNICQELWCFGKVLK